MQKLWLVIFVIGFMQLAQDVWAQDTPENPDTNQHCKAVLVSGLSPSNPFYADMYRPAYAELRPLRYDQLQVHHLEEAIRFTKHQLDHVQQEVINLVDAPTFANTVEPVLSALAWHGRSKSVLHMMHILNSSKEIDELAEKLSPLLASDLLPAFYLRVSQIKNVPELTETQQYIVADILSNPEAQKIKMSSEQIAKILEIDEQLRTKERTFRKNFESAQKQIVLLAADTQFEPGMPAAVLAEAQDRAKNLNQKGYAFLLKPEQIDQSNFVLEYATDPDVRRSFYEAYVNRGLVGAYDNRELTQEILNLRLERSKILGFENFAQTVLPTLMMGSTENLKSFIASVKPEYLKMAAEEVSEIKALKKELTGLDGLDPWDMQFYAKKLEVKKLNWDVSEAVPYFEVNGALARTLTVIGRIYNLQFVPAPTVKTWNSDVKVFNVKNLNTGESLGLIYFDLLMRANKSPAAFAEELKAPGYYRSFNGKRYHQKSHVLVNMGVRKGTGGGPSFFTLRNMQSLFHEIGHAIHSLSSKVDFPSYGSFAAPIDFVELPSQLLENWIYQPEVFNELARHYQTGELVPAEWLTKIPYVRGMNPAMKTLARRGIMMELDLAWHSVTSPVTDIMNMSQQVTKDWSGFDYLLAIAANPVLNPYAFMHGYESKFHGYQWCETLDYDTFELFKENGIFNHQIGKRFMNLLLSKGAILRPREDYRNFRGRDPDPLAIVRKFRDAQTRE